MTATARLPRDGARLRKAALAYPEAYEDMPWGHHAIKVKGKTFLFLGADATTFSLSAKLPSSADVALKLPFASPTEYGLGEAAGSPPDFPVPREYRWTFSSCGSTRVIAQSHPSASSLKLGPTVRQPVP